jgi:hypothetical protein
MVGGTGNVNLDDLRRRSMSERKTSQQKREVSRSLFQSKTTSGQCIETIQ